MIIVLKTPLSLISPAFFNFIKCMARLDTCLPAVLPAPAEDQNQALSQAQPQAKHEEQKD
jgi:hypothetical protein